jgi:prepilin-type N-terminal cleavage/methylation domain-containing protein
MATIPRKSKSGFTLVEMLVSIAVLVLIMTFIAQMMNSVTMSTTLSDKHIDTDNQARLVFDRMAMDFAGMPLRNDLEYLFVKEAMNSEPGQSNGGTTDFSDKMFFFSDAPAYFSSSNDELFPTAPTVDPKSSVALIGYCINTGSNNTGGDVPPANPYFLQRLSKGLAWDQGYPLQGSPGGQTFLTFPPLSSGSNTWTPISQSTLSGNSFLGPAVGGRLSPTGPDYSGTDSDFDTIGNQVFRLEFVFQVRDLAPGANGGTAFSNFPVAVYTDTNSQSNSLNTTNYQSSDPTVSGSTGHIGDRWYNFQDNRAFELTGYIPAITGATGLQSQGTTTWSPIGLSDVTAVVVTIAIMDANSRKILTKDELASAASYLPKFDNGRNNPPSPASTAPDLPATLWQQALNSQETPFARQADIPQSAASQIRVYQRFFYLNQYN